jgi:hypothetical protein
VRRRTGRLVYVCEGAGPQTVTLAEDWTDRSGAPAQRALTYERLADLAKALRAIRGRLTCA